MKWVMEINRGLRQASRYFALVALAFWSCVMLAVMAAVIVQEEVGEVLVFAQDQPGMWYDWPGKCYAAMPGDCVMEWEKRGDGESQEEAMVCEWLAEPSSISRGGRAGVVVRSEGLARWSSVASVELTLAKVEMGLSDSGPEQGDVDGRLAEFFEEHVDLEGCKPRTLEGFSGGPLPVMKGEGWPWRKYPVHRAPWRAGGSRATGRRVLRGGGQPVGVARRGGKADKVGNGQGLLRRGRGVRGDGDGR